MLNTITPYREVERLLENMRALATKPESFDRYSDQIASLCRAYMAPDVPSNPIPGADLQPNEQALMHYLIARGDRVATRDGILDILDHRSGGGASHHKSVDVYVCRLRKVLKTADVPYDIETIRNRGYRLINKSEQAKAA